MKIDIVARIIGSVLAIISYFIVLHYELQL